MSGSARPPWEEELTAQVLAEERERAEKLKWKPKGGIQDGTGTGAGRVQLHVHMHPSSGEPAAQAGSPGDSGGYNPDPRQQSAAAAPLQAVQTPAAALPAVDEPHAAATSTVDPESLPAVSGYQGYQPYKLEDKSRNVPPVAAGVLGLFQVPQRAVYRLLSPEHGDPSPLLFFPWASIFALTLFGTLVALLVYCFNNFGDEMNAMVDKLQQDIAARQRRPGAAETAEEARAENKPAAEGSTEGPAPAAPK
jgi:hypothetical protein